MKFFPLFAFAILIGCGASQSITAEQKVAKKAALEAQMPNFLEGMKTLCIDDQNDDKRDLAMRIKGYVRIDDETRAQASQPKNEFAAKIAETLAAVGLEKEPPRGAGTVIYRNIINKEPPKRDLFGSSRGNLVTQTVMSITNQDGNCVGLIQDATIDLLGKEEAIAFALDELKKFASKSDVESPALDSASTTAVRIGDKDVMVGVRYQQGVRGQRIGSQRVTRTGGLSFTLVPLKQS